MLTMMRSIADAAKTVATATADGKPMVAAPAVVAARQAVCVDCEHWRAGDGRCALCGCWTAARIRLAALSCPIDKWGPETGVTNDDPQGS